jgi:hypothetical protein
MPEMEELLIYPITISTLVYLKHVSVELPPSPGRCRVVESPGSQVGGGRALHPHQTPHQIWCRPPNWAGCPALNRYMPSSENVKVRLLVYMHSCADWYLFTKLIVIGCYGLIFCNFDQTGIVASGDIFYSTLKIR